MKKSNNKIAKFTLLVLLIILIAIAVVLVSGTYAKYATTAKGTDKARVAHWKINTTNNISDLFAASYPNVKAGTTDLGIIAPGTSGNFEFSLDGSVETAYKLKIDATGTDEVNGAINEYNPITYSFKKNSEEATTNLTFAELLEKINNIDDGNQTHEPGDISKDIYTIGWEWSFTGDDIKDTELGNLVATEDKTVSLSVTLTAVQVGQ